MSKRTRTLAWIWLGLAWVGLVPAGLLAMLAMLVGLSQAAVPVLFIFLAAVWVAPPAVASVALLWGHRCGWRLLVACAGLSCLVWLVLCSYMVPESVRGVGGLLHGQYWGGFPAAPLETLGCLAMLAFSGLTVRWLLHDPPGKWASAPPGEDGR
jgi:hypothetical protein